MKRAEARQRVRFLAEVHNNASVTARPHPLLASPSLFLEVEERLYQVLTSPQALTHLRHPAGPSYYFSSPARPITTPPPHPLPPKSHSSSFRDNNRRPMTTITHSSHVRRERIPISLSRSRTSSSSSYSSSEPMSDASSIFPFLGPRTTSPSPITTHTHTDKDDGDDDATVVARQSGHEEICTFIVLHESAAQRNNNEKQPTGTTASGSPRSLPVSLRSQIESARRRREGHPRRPRIMLTLPATLADVVPTYSAPVYSTSSIPFTSCTPDSPRSPCTRTAPPSADVRPRRNTTPLVRSVSAPSSPALIRQLLQFAPHKPLSSSVSLGASLPDGLEKLQAQGLSSEGLLVLDVSEPATGPLVVISAKTGREEGKPTSDEEVNEVKRYDMIPCRVVLILRFFAHICISL